MYKAWGSRVWVWVLSMLRRDAESLSDFRVPASCVVLYTSCWRSAVTARST